MKAYKGFNKDMTCRGFQYEDGKEYETDKASLYNEGFHACENPIDCFSYYSPSESVYHEVEIEDNGERGNDTKVVGKRIKIGAKISIAGIIKATFEYVKSHSTNDRQGGDCSALQGGDCSALQGGYKSALQGGDWSALQGGNCSALQGGNCSALQGGNWSALQGGDWSALQGGDYSALQGGYNSALQGGDYSALQGGDWSALQGGDNSALQGGDWSALQGGDNSALQGGDLSVVYGGKDAKVKGGLHSVIALQYWVDNKLKCIKFKEVDGEEIKADTFYMLQNGEFTECEED